MPISQQAFENYFLYWLRAKIRTIPAESIVAAIKENAISYPVSKVLMRDALMSAIGADNLGVQEVLRVSELLGADPAVPYFSDAMFEVRLHCLLLLKQYDDVLTAVAEYEQGNPENSVTISAKITALSALDFEGNEARIMALMQKGA